MKVPPPDFARLLEAYPRERDVITRFAEQARKYSGECGCSLGAKFLVATLAVSALYFFRHHQFIPLQLARDAGLSLLCIFVSGVVGKLIGIGLARVRLAQLYRQLAVRYQGA